MSTDGEAALDTQGGIITNAEGVMVAIGAGGLDAPATVKVTTVLEDDLSLALPSNQETGETTFNYLGAFDLEVDGGNLTAPIQIAVPVNGGYTPGETVYFFQNTNQPVGPNGERIDVWTIMDSGTVGEDGMARTASPPFPGMSNRGSVLIARSAQPLGIIRIDMGYVFGVMAAMVGTLGICATGGLAGAAVGIGLAGLYAGLLVLPIAYQQVNIKIWREWAGNVQGFDLDVNMPEGAPFLNVLAEVPPVPTTTNFTEPLITGLQTTVADGGDVTLEINGLNFTHATESPGMTILDTRVGFVMGGYTEYVEGSDYTSADEASGKITLKVPTSVLLGMSDIVVQRKTIEPLSGSQSWISSIGTSRVDNKGGYGFVGRQNELAILDTARPDEPLVREKITKVLNLVSNGAGVGSVLDTVATKDFSRVFVATNRGVSVVDAFTLQQFDTDLSTAGIDSIVIPGGVTALAIDASERYLYAAGLGKIYVIDLEMGSDQFHQVAQTIAVEAPDQGRINDLVVNADGTRLFVAVPVTSMFGVNGWVQGQNQPGHLVVINVDEKDKPGPNQSNGNSWREVIGTFDTGIETYGLAASGDPTLLMVTSRLQLQKGLQAIKITNNSATGFDVKLTTINLKLNKEHVFVKYFGGGYFGSGFASRSTSQIHDLDVRNASAVVIAPDLSYAFVTDWYLPRMYYHSDYVLAFDIEELHKTGSKIGLIKDPFNLKNLPDSGTIVAATSPIPMSFLSEVALDATGKKLYANFRGAGNIAVYDVEGMIARSESSLSYTGPLEWDRFPLDHNWADLASGTSINLAPIDIERYSRGLSLQSINVLNLIAPTGFVDTTGTGSDALVFEWEVDTDLLGGNPGDVYTSRLVVSSQAPGNGLWPDDDWRERPEDGVLSYLGADFVNDPDLADDDDTNPGRILTSPFSLLVGKKYKATATAGGIQFTLAGDSGNTKRTIVELDATVRKALTAGQLYHWGVYLEHSGEDTNIFQAGTFRAQAVASTATYSGVTVLTHGFQLSLSSSFNNQGQFKQPDAFMQMARMIVDAAGGGVVLAYDKLSGLWVDRSVWNGYGPPPLSALAGSVIQSGKAVVLVSDWHVESDISDSGFSEAAADALYASLVDLDKQVGGIFTSPLHFIGHSRGTVVNSEIIQRLGANGKVTSGIHMTTLDPHDFDQKSLDVPLGTALEKVEQLLTLAQAGYVVGGIVAPVTAPAAIIAITRLQNIKSKIEWARDTAEMLGIALNIPYGDFKDPDVRIWDNVGFSDNYYQTAASEPEESGPIVTATPNGRPLDPAPSAVPGNPSAPKTYNQSESAADIDMLLDQIAGFGFEDFSFIGGLPSGFGGPHSRVWQWYAGTINTGVLEFQDMPIWRSAGDQGLATEILNVIALPNAHYSDQAWYASNPYRIVGGNGRNLYTQQPSNLASDIHEGITVGWYFSSLGGGSSYQPDRGGATTPYATDNTEVNKPADPVPTVFNGDFENGLRQSLYARATGSDDKGRFPFSYELPGWSFHGGEGFSVNNGFQIGGFSLPDVDFTGLFVFETNPSQLVVDFFKKTADFVAGKAVEMLAAHVKFEAFGLPKPPGTPGAPETSEPGYAELYNQFFGENTLGADILDSAGKLYTLFEGLVSQYAGLVIDDVTIADFKLADLFELDPEKKAAIPKNVSEFKSFLVGAIEAMLKSAWSPQSDYALLMGGANILKDLVFAAGSPWIPPALADVSESISDVVIDTLVNFDTITHNRLHIPADKPYLAFEVLAPFMFTDDGSMKITFKGAGADAGLAPVSIDVKLTQQGFMKKQTYSVAVPDQYKDKIATISFTKEKSEGKTGLPWTVADATVDLASSFSQLMFLDDIRLTDSAIDITVNSPIDENGTATATFTLLGPLDAAQATVLDIDWGDGQSQSVTLPAGTNSTTLSHFFPDDNPSGTTQDTYTIHANSSNTVAGGSKALVVRNVAPGFTMLQLSSQNIMEADEVTLTGHFTDIGTQDSFSIVIDWGDGETTTLTNLGTDSGAGIDFSATHTFADDHPATGTAQDELQVTVTVYDDDNGQDVGQLPITVNNVAPTFTSLVLSETEIDEDNRVTLDGEFDDPGIRDTYTLEIDWGDGTVQTHTIAAQPSGHGSFSYEHQYVDDDPDTGTPFDLLDVKVKLVDDDTGEASSTLPIRVNNVAPEFGSVTLTPNPLDEGGEVTLAGDFTDPGDDTFTIEVDWGDGNVETFNLDDVGSFSEGSGQFSIPHAYADDEAPGDDDIFEVSFRLIDDDTGEASDTAQVTVNNLPPTLENLSLDNAVIDEGDSVTLSMDLDDPGVDDVLTVEIDWGDGSIDIYPVGTAPLGFEASHTYVDDDPSGTGSDTYAITVTVIDDDDDTVTAGTQVTVNNVAPQDLDAGPNQNLALGITGITTTVLDVSFDDPGLADTSQIAWAVTTPLGGLIQNANQSFVLTLNEPGIWNATVTVTDDDGGSASTSVSILAEPTIIEPPDYPVVPIDPFDEGDTVSMNVVLQGSFGASAYKLRVNWGDGTIENVTASSGTNTLTHVYEDDRPDPEPNQYTATVQLINSQFTQSFHVHPLHSQVFLVENVDPTPSFTWQSLGNGVVQLNGVIADPGTLDTHAIEWSIGGNVVTSTLTPQFTFTAPVTVSLTVTDDDLGSGTISQFIPNPITGTAGGASTTAGTQLNPRLLALQKHVVSGLWRATGADADALASVRIMLADLPGSELANTVLGDTPVITVDVDAAGRGWYVDVTPQPDEIFSGMDLVTVLAHELGHVLGLHHATANHALGSVMSPYLEAGVRRLPKTGDLLLTSADPAAMGELSQSGAGIVNGSFSVSDPGASNHGWIGRGDASIVAGEAVLAEQGQFLSGFEQTFLIPDNAIRLSFTIRDLDLLANASGPVDAFEMALLDAGGQSLIGLAPLANTDAALNIQTGGAVYAAGKITIAGLANRNGGLLDLSAPIRVDVDLAGIAAGTAATLYFDLLGMGSRLSSAIIDDVRIVTGDGGNQPPIAEDDSATVDENAVVVIAVLANDTDAQGDPLTTRIVTGPAHGSLELLADGSYRYTPEADFHGKDGFSYIANDGEFDSTLATVTITVQPVNDAPTAVDHIYTTDEDTTLDVAAIGVLVGVIDPDGGPAQAVLVDGPQHGDLTLLADGSFIYTPDANYHGQDGFTYTVNDGLADSNVATVQITIDPVNDLPTLETLDDVDLDEGQTLDLTAIAHDVDGDDDVSFELLQAPDGAAIDANGRILWTALDGDASAQFTVRVSDPSGAQATRSFTARVANVPPMLGLAGPPTASQGFAYTVLLDQADPGDDTITEWVIDWGDGSESIVAGDATQASHVYDTRLGPTRIQALARDEDGDWAGPLLDIDVIAMPLQVLSFTPDCDGFSVRFNQAFDQDQLNLFGNGRMPGDVVLQGAASGIIDGSLLIDADGMGFSFLKTGTPLRADSYTVTIKSGPTALTSASGDLDGNGDGTAGDDFTAVRSINPPTQIKLGLPDFMRGPGQAVDVPIAAGAGLPVTLTSEGDVRSLQFEIRYDAALLQLVDASGGAGLPAGATLDVDLSVPGLARISITSPTLLPAGALQLVNLSAMVPFDATYKARHRVDIAAVTINDQLVECADDDALHIVGYIGDANGNMTYELEDVQMIQRTAIRLNTGFAAWDDLSPLIIADIDGNGVITTIDASRVYQELSGYNSALIPDIPSPEAFRIAAEQRAAHQQQQPPAPASASPQQAQGSSASGGGTAAARLPGTDTSSGTTAPAVRFNNGLLDFGIGKPVNSNDWLVSWVAGTSKSANGNDWKVILP